MKFRNIISSLRPGQYTRGSFSSSFTTIIREGTAKSSLNPNNQLNPAQYNYFLGTLEDNWRDKSHLKFVINPESYKYAAKLLRPTVNKDDKITVEEITNEDFRDTKLTHILFSGSGFNSMPAMASLYKGFRTLQYIDNKPRLRGSTINAAIYYPALEEEPRYDQAISYSLNPHYISEEFNNFTKDILIPSIIKSINSDNPYLITLFSYSLGGREIMMIENSLRHILTNEHNFSPSQVKDWFSLIQAVCVGFVVNLSSLPSPRFRKIIIYGIEDLGVLRPKSFYNIVEAGLDTILDNYYSHTEPNTIDESNYYEKFIILGRNVLDKEINGKENVKRHSFPGYIKAICSNDELLQFTSFFSSNVHIKREKESCRTL
jgi:hypothetical protein